MDSHPGFATDLLFDRYQGEVVRRKAGKAGKIGGA